MSSTFADLQAEVKRRATRNQSGTAYDEAVKSLINFSLLRIANEAPWRALRRNASFLTVPDYHVGTIAATVGSTAVTFSTATLITSGVKAGRRLKFEDGGATPTLFIINEVTSETTAVLNLPYNGNTDITAGNYKIMGQEVYNLPIQTSRTAVLYHEAYNYPYVMGYVSDREFLETGIDFNMSDKPVLYRMWGEDCVMTQPQTPGYVSAVSTSTADTTVQVSIFGMVGGYPDSETITLNGTTPVVNSTGKVFQSIDRVSKDKASSGLITLTANSGNTTIAVLPVGDTSGSIMYKKIQLFPSPNAVYEIKVLYYKEILRLVNDDDIHELGQDFDEAIICLATRKLNGEQSKQETEAFNAFFKEELSVLRRKNSDKLDWLPRLQKPGVRTRLGFHRYSRYMQVGSQYGPYVR